MMVAIKIVHRGRSVRAASASAPTSPSTSVSIRSGGSTRFAIPSEAIRFDGVAEFEEDGVFPAGVVDLAASAAWIAASGQEFEGETAQPGKVSQPAVLGASPPSGASRQEGSLRRIGEAVTLEREGTQFSLTRAMLLETAADE
jgi:hypothetical protein